MVFNRTSCGRKSKRGFTLVEYLFATSIGVMILAAGVTMWAYATRNCAALVAYVDLSTTSKNALDRMTQQIRNAKDIDACSATELRLILHGGNGNNVPKMTYTYDAQKKSLIQKYQKNSGNSAEVTTLLTGCTNFVFSMYKRVPSSNSWELAESTGDTNLTKVVQMRWTCVRALTGEKNMIENQVSAKVMIRNQ